MSPIASNNVVPNEQPLSLSSPSNRLAPFNPTSATAQEIALRLLNLDQNDILFDLGCGDARFLVSAVELTHPPGLQCIGIECNPKFIPRADKMIKSKVSAI